MIIFPSLSFCANYVLLGLFSFSPFINSKLYYFLYFPVTVSFSSLSFFPSLASFLSVQQSQFYSTLLLYVILDNRESHEIRIAVATNCIIQHHLQIQKKKKRLRLLYKLTCVHITCSIPSILSYCAILARLCYAD